MPRFEGFKNISQGIFYWALIVVAGIFITWLIISGIGNFILDRKAEGIKPPDVEKARYVLFMQATNRSIFTDSYNTAYHQDAAGRIDYSKKVYTLHGYFELSKNKYVWNKSSISLDEFYYGKITLVDREN